MSNTKITIGGKTWSSVDKQKSEKYYKNLAKKQGGVLTPKQVSEKQKVSQWFWQLGFEEAAAERKDLFTPERTGFAIGDSAAPLNVALAENLKKGLRPAPVGTPLAGDTAASLRQETYSPVQQFLETSPLFQPTSPRERDFTPDPVVPPNTDLAAKLANALALREGQTNPDLRIDTPVQSVVNELQNPTRRGMLVDDSNVARNTLVEELAKGLRPAPGGTQLAGDPVPSLQPETYSPLARFLSQFTTEGFGPFHRVANPIQIVKEVVKKDNAEKTAEVVEVVTKLDKAPANKIATGGVRAGAQFANAVGTENNNNEAYKELLASSLLGGGRTDPWDRFFKALMYMPKQGSVSLAEAFTGGVVDVTSAEAAAKKEALARQLKIEDLAARRRQYDITTGIALERLDLAEKSYERGGQPDIPKVTAANINAMITFIQSLGSSADYSDLYSSDLWPEFLGGKPHNKIQMEKILAREALEIMNAERISNSEIALKKAIARRRGGDAASAPAQSSTTDFRNLEPIDVKEVAK